VENITAHNGGDCSEYGMEGILRAIRLSEDKSHIIVLTDADCKDCDKMKRVIRNAKDIRTPIHFFFGKSDCLDKFIEYKTVQEKTGGVYVNSIKAFHSLCEFIAKLNKSNQNVHKPKRRACSSSTLSSYKHQTFNISIFAINFELIVKSSTSVRVCDPMRYRVKLHKISNDVSGYISNKQPKNGTWSIYTKNENSQFSITERDILDFSVDYYQDGYCSIIIPPAGR